MNIRCCRPCIRGLAAVAALLLLTACAPAISLVRSEFSIPLYRGTDAPQAERLSIELRSLMERIDVGALPANSDRVLHVEADHAFALQVVDEGVVERRLGLISEDAPSNFSYVGDTPVWSVGIHPLLPIALRVRSGAGDINLNLGRFDLIGVQIETIAGAARAVLPVAALPYPVSARSEAGSVNLVFMTGSTVDLTAETENGNINLNMATGASVNGSVTSISGAVEIDAAAHVNGSLRVRTSSGTILIDVTDSAPGLRVDIRQIGSGSISMPAFMNYQGGADEGSTQGIWESADYAAAGQRLSLIVETGSGTITVR